MKNLTQSKLYAELKKDGGSTPILYYSDTGIAVTPESFDRVVTLEKERYGLKLLEAQESDPNNMALQLDLDAIVPAQVKRFMHGNLLHVQVVYVTAENVDEVLEVVQRQPNFHSWCVE